MSLSAALSAISRARSTAPVSFTWPLVKGGNLDSGKIFTGNLVTLQSLTLQ